MRLLLCLLAITAILICATCFFLGYRSGLKQSLLEEDRRGILTLTLNGYKALESTSWSKVQSLLTIEMVAFTRDYEKHFGIPTGTNSFAGRFAEAKAIADRLEKQLVPMNDLGPKLGTNVAIEYK
jgi:hypothetical protein